MSSLPDKWFNDTIYVRDFTSVNSDGDFVFGTAYAVKARIEVKVETYRTFQGELQKSSHIIYTKVAIPNKAVVYLDGDLTTTLDLGREAMAYHATPSINHGERLYKTWLSFFGS